jgi:hypothetical protein
MYLVKLVDEENFYALMELHKELYDIVEPSSKNSQRVISLLEDLKKPDAFVIGLFLSAKLVGFISGHRLDEETFHFVDIYIKPRHRLQAKKITTEAEDLIKRLGYKSWEASVVGDGIPLTAHLGAKTKRILCRKEL